ncbi:hypothetical protein L914_10228, partial [Phytophthora nicotianae]
LIDATRDGRGKSKVSDQQLWRKYRKLIKDGFSDEGIAGARVRKGEKLDKIYDNWIRLGKSSRQAANNLLKQNKTPKELFAVLNNRDMDLEEIYKIWRAVELDEPQLYRIWAKLAGNN